MLRLRTATEPEECRRLWAHCVPRERLTDLWEVRACFHQSFRRALLFIVAERNGRISGLLPLAWMQEARAFGYFPGEAWHGRTWLEQNRVIADGPQTLEAMLDYLYGIGSGHHLRYLLVSAALPADAAAVDEVGYLFEPGVHEYNMENYWTQFSGKSRKRIRQELKGLAARDLTVRLDEPGDVELMVRLNVSRFGDDSYFADSRFTEGFMGLCRLLSDKGWLRTTTALIEGEPAAADVGAVFRGVYTLLAGGTDPGFPGVAKFINVYHMERACRERLECVDFLCGEFSWKPMFHLSPRPLYLLADDAVDTWQGVTHG